VTGRRLPTCASFLDNNEHVWRRIGDLGRVAEQAWIALIAATTPLTVQAIERADC